MEDKYHQAIAESKVTEDDAAVKAAVDKILAENLKENMNEEVYKFLFNCIDLTTLRSTDSPRSVADFVERVNDFDNEHPEMKNVAAICVYPNFSQVVRTVLEVSDVDIACVAGCFPSSQSFLEVKVAEVALAVEGGADEIDIVLNLGNFLDGDYEEVCDEISELKHSCREARLKVILEAGALKTAANIKAASILSMYSGADFIKTSTGKEYPGASLEAAYVMAQAIKESKAGKIEYRLDKTNIIHCPIGKASFGAEKLLENYTALITAILRAKPATAKGQYIRSCVTATTMGPGIKINAQKQL